MRHHKRRLFLKFSRKFKGIFKDGPIDNFVMIDMGLMHNSLVVSCCVIVSFKDLRWVWKKSYYTKRQVKVQTGYRIFRQWSPQATKKYPANLRLKKIVWSAPDRSQRRAYFVAQSHQRLNYRVSQRYPNTLTLFPTVCKKCEFPVFREGISDFDCLWLFRLAPISTNSTKMSATS